MGYSRNPFLAAVRPQPLMLGATPTLASTGGGIPSNVLSVKFADGSMGFLDPSDGTYYDDQGDDVTGYVQNFGGANVLGPASPAAIAAVNGQPVPPSVPTAIVGPAPRVAVSQPAPAPAKTVFTSDTIIAGVPDLFVLGGGLLVAMVALQGLGGGGGRRRR